MLVGYCRPVLKCAPVDTLISLSCPLARRSGHGSFGHTDSAVSCLYQFETTSAEAEDETSWVLVSANNGSIRDSRPNGFTGSCEEA